MMRVISLSFYDVNFASQLYNVFKKTNPLDF